MDHISQQRNQPLPIVLIVDDNPAIRNVVCWSLQLGGFEPIEAANGLEALRWMQQAANEQRYPAVILLDLAMPAMDGETFLHWLQSQWPKQRPHPSIIIITAGYTDEKRLHPYVKQVVTKPFHVRDLLEIVNKWVVV